MDKSSSVFDDKNVETTKNYIPYVRIDMVEITKAKCGVSTHEIVVAHVLVTCLIDNLNKRVCIS